MSERKEPFEAGRDAIRNLAEKFADPTEAEIAAADNIWQWNNRHQPKLWSGIIARHNAPLHAKIAAQKAALELAEKQILRHQWTFSNNQACIICSSCECSREHGHHVLCKQTAALAAINEALQ